jgi:hypothetical protein
VARKHSTVCHHSLERVVLRNGRETKNFICAKCRKVFRQVR